ncbi:uncharacterized protein LOC114322091 [Camellia sinensis]|uniref:uncharacterized protein LOC114322091 n=1 Tax=Camellia sinensis TaxID=4442 RepID=UPI001035FD75|nr:uncharacterized protein LOC114322091 [Camellia sinensis]
MAKRSRVRALLTETTRPEVAPPSQSQPAVVALPSQQPSSSRRTKRARTAEPERVLIDEEPPIQPSFPPSPQPESSDRTIGCWAPKLTFNDRDILDTDSVVAEKDHLLAINLARSVCLPKDMEHHQKQLTTELKSIRSATKSMILAIQKNQITHRKVLELRKVTRQAAAEAEAKSAELEEARKELAELRGEVGRLTGMVSSAEELEAENGRLADLVNSAEAEKQKAAIVMKDKYLRELLKLEKRKDAEMSELKKNMEAVDKGGYKRGFKEAETEVFNPPEYFIPKSLAGFADALQQQFLEGSDTDEDSASEDTPVENVDQIDRPESRVEDLTIEQPNETVAPVDTTIVTEGVLPPETGLPADTDAAFDAEIEDLFA